MSVRIPRLKRRAVWFIDSLEHSAPKDLIFRSTKVMAHYPMQSFAVSSSVVLNEYYGNSVLFPSVVDCRSFISFALKPAVSIPIGQNPSKKNLVFFRRLVGTPLGRVFTV
jgi:hypothetical protein